MSRERLTYADKRPDTAEDAAALTRRVAAPCANDQAAARSSDATA
jgi:hypothetical protein